ncbi:MAG: FkbM family methyltransferase [Leeuwenhoekiella sp.]
MVKSSLRKLAQITGFYIKPRRFTPLSSENYRTVKILETLNINKVLDVGANEGQFAISLIDYGYTKGIVSFEPASLSHNVLREKAVKFDSWQIADRTALGDREGSIKLNISQDSQFNSIKKIRPNFTEQFKQSKVEGQEEVSITKLDSLKDKYYDDSENIFLKIDTQGFEKEILTGATDLLKKALAIKIEIPLHFIYNEVDWGIVEIFNFFDQNGFGCGSLSEISASKWSGLVQEVDGIFIRKELIQGFVK